MNVAAASLFLALCPHGPLHHRWRAPCMVPRSFLSSRDPGRCRSPEHVTAAHRRQQGHGARLTDADREGCWSLSGVRAGEIIGAPIATRRATAIGIIWREIMDLAPHLICRHAVERDFSLPGHADLTGFHMTTRMMREISSSGRPPARRRREPPLPPSRRRLESSRVRIEATVHSGGTTRRPETFPDDLNAAADASQLRTLDADAEEQMIASH